MVGHITLTRTTASERRGLLLTAVTAIIPFLLLAVWAYLAPPTAIEQQLVDALALGQNLPGDAITAINTLGNPQNWIVLTIAVAVAVALFRGMSAGLFVGATYLVDFLANASKAMVERGRPDTITAHLLFGVDSFGYPSGHSARAAALVGALIWVLVPARWRLPGAIIGSAIAGLVMGYARIAFGVHFPSDVLGGLLLGLAWFAATALLL